MQSGGSGGSFNFVSVGVLKTLQIPLPPLSIQEEIVAEIEGYQNEIEEMKKKIKESENKIKDRIAEVWGVDKSKEDGLNLAAEAPAVYEKG